MEGLIRKPVVSGLFYSDNPLSLIKEIEWSFSHHVGPGALPSSSEGQERLSIGYVSPHAGYVYSGPVAAHAYYHLSLEKTPDTIVIIGTNHSGLGENVSLAPWKEWETPLGKVMVDVEARDYLIKNASIIKPDYLAHIEEHSVEVQLPFIQYIYSDKVKIVPIVIGIHTPEAAIDIAESIVRATNELSRDVVVLASSDFNHYESHDITVKKDEAAISKILELNTHGFYKTLVDMDISICGPGGIMSLIEIAKRLKARAMLLKHATSGDISGNKTAVVGYAAIKFSRI